MKRFSFWFLTRLVAVGCAVCICYFERSWRTGRSTRELFLAEGWDHHLFFVGSLLIISALTEKAFRLKRAEAPKGA